MGPQRYDRVSSIVRAAQAWLAMINVVEATLTLKQENLASAGARLRPKTRKNNLLDIREPEITGRPETCEPVEWISRDPPVYPAGSAAQGYVGAAYVQYSLDQDGVPHDVTVSAEVPARKFGSSAVKAVMGWRAKPMPNAPVACREFIEVQFRFQMGN